MSARYAAGTLDEAAAWSLEKHVEVCGGCAAAVSAAVRSRGDAARVLEDVRGALLGALPAPAAAPRRSSGAADHSGHARAGAADRPARSRRLGRPGLPGLPGRMRRLGRAGLPGRTGRLGRVLWAAGPALRGAWVIAVLLVCAGAVGLAYGADVDGVRPLLLALAPLLPPAGVAMSYGPSADPAHEIALASPSGALRLLLTRSAAVLAVSLPLLTAAGAVVPDGPGVPGAAAWLLPGLALTLGCLALGSYLGCTAAAGLLSGAWAITVLAPALLASRRGGGVPWEMALTDHLARCLSGAGAQAGWAAAAALCAALVALRRHSFDLAPGPGRPRV
ncbi:zf-HC2 domain-containing protein [Streptomyces sp. LX-29]|nr:zf-HC2 domain-containing protein [Streptomyces sp. LX-29]WFB11617.1 zf-HC2 domain-containing protein [Streptomyces sp. LX-29]